MQTSEIVQRIEHRLAMLEAGSTHMDLVELARDIRAVVAASTPQPPVMLASPEATQEALIALNKMSPGPFTMDDGRNPYDVLRAYIQLTGSLR